MSIYKNFDNVDVVSGSCIVRFIVELSEDRQRFKWGVQGHFISVTLCRVTQIKLGMLLLTISR